MASGDIAALKDTPIYIPQGAARTYDLFSYDLDADELRRETDRDRSDLSSALITMVVRNAAGVIQFTKLSSDIAQIEINADQVSLVTKGSSILKILVADTMALIVGAEYWYDVWVDYGDGRVDRIIRKSRFHVLDGVVT